MANVARKSTQLFPLILLLMVIGFFGYVSMMMLSASVRDGWQVDDLIGLLRFALFAGGAFIIARKVQRVRAETVQEVSDWRTAADSATYGNTHSWRTIAAVVGVLFLAGIIYAATQSDSRNPSATAAPPSVAQTTQIDTAVIRNPRGQLSEAALDDDMAEKLRVGFESQYLGELRDSYAKAGNDPATFNLDLKSDAEVSEFQGHHVILIYLQAPGVSRAVAVVGIAADEIVQVSCIHQSGGLISLSDGACHAEMAKAFPVIASSG